jgi:hypothetical protein
MWSLISKKGHKFSVFHNKEPQKIYGLERDELNEEWRKVYTLRLGDL